jgi:glycosyltransferase involved in cell wall biosynthesis
MSKIFLFSLEDVPTRYTSQWKTHLPEVLRNQTELRVVDVCPNVEEVIPASTGGFLNFVETNGFKARQLDKFVEMVRIGIVESGDIVLFADAWNPAIINVKYIADLADIDLKLVGLWHAGSYIAEDPLGQKIKDKSWSHLAEASMYQALDVNIFATQYHMNFFLQSFSYLDIDESKALVSGFPMEYISKIDFPKLVKEDLVIFPHRVSPEKQVDLFKAIEKRCEGHGIEFIVCQEHHMGKKEYHDAIARAKVMFSGALLETLGICQMEAMVGGCLPLVPDRLSYSEMYVEPEGYAYPSRLSEPGWDDNDVEVLAERVIDMVRNYEWFAINSAFNLNLVNMYDNFFCGDVLYSKIKELANNG